MGEHEEYRAHLVRQGASVQTIRAYMEALDRLERWAGKPVHEVTPDEAAAWINRPHLSRSTRNAYHRRLSAWCAWSGSHMLEGVRRPRPAGPSPKPLDPARVDLMLAACRSEEDTALVLLGVLAGLRRMEMARFRGDHLDVWDSSIMVRGKGGADEWVPAPPALVRHARRMPPAGWWFPSPSRPGLPVSPYTIGARARVIAARADAGHVTTHRLRHTYATELVRGGVPLTTVQRMMRHKQLGTTAAYVGVAGQDLHGAAAMLPWAGSGPDDPPMLVAA